MEEQEIINFNQDKINLKTNWNNETERLWKWKMMISWPIYWLKVGHIKCFFGGYDISWLMSWLHPGKLQIKLCADKRVLWGNWNEPLTYRLIPIIGEIQLYRNVFALRNK